MPLPAFHRLLSSFLPSTAADAGMRTTSRPPLLQRRAPAWLARFGLQRARMEALGAARLAFGESLLDLHSPAAVDARSRIAVARSLYDLWHLREEVFSLVACRHDQAEGARRLAALDRHFGRSPQPAARRAHAARRNVAGA